MVRSRFTVNLLRRLVWALLTLAPTVLLPGGAHAEDGARDRFVVVPFTNQGGVRALDFLQAGLPVLLAERLASHPRLRFAGGSSVVDRVRLDETLARAAATGVKWVVAGRYEKRPDWRIQVTVDVFAAGDSAAAASATTTPAAGAAATPPRPAGQAHAVGTKDEVARTALTAAVDAFTAAGLSLPGASRAAVTAPFARDPYAFVLFGRGVAAFTGLGARPGGAGNERAVKILERSLVIDPKIAETRHYLGVVHLAAGRPGHARAMWSSAVDLRPDYLAAIAGLAALDRTAGLSSARERYARVLELDPDDLDARRAHGELLSEAGSLEEAQAELAKVIAAAPGDLRARRALALVLASRHAGVELAAELAELVRLDPEDLAARLDLGAAQSSIGQIDPAIATYEEVLRRRPRQAAVLKLTGDLYRAKGDAARAASFYERLHRVAPDDPRPVFLLGSAYYQAGRLDAAERMFTEATRYPGMLGDAYSNLGAIAVRRGQVKEALWFLSRAAQRRPGKPQVRYNYALALEAAQRFEEALVELDAAAKIAPGDAQVRFLTGVIALRLGRAVDAEANFHEALRLDPTYDSARHNLALLESIRGRSESAYSFEK